jgi:hypothetical protein
LDQGLLSKFQKVARTQITLLERFWGFPTFTSFAVAPQIALPSPEGVLLLEKKTLPSGSYYRCHLSIIPKKPFKYLCSHS